jgi:hypothetical protein
MTGKMNGIVTNSMMISKTVLRFVHLQRKVVYYLGSGFMFVLSTCYPIFMMMMFLHMAHLLLLALPGPGWGSLFCTNDVMSISRLICTLCNVYHVH